MANITKKLHQGCDLCYLHLPNFLLNIHSSLLKENKNLLSLLFFSVNQATGHCSMAYITRLFQCEDWFHYD